MNLFVMGLVFVAGFFATMQAGVNYILSEYLRSDLLAALVSFVVGSIGLFIFIVIYGLEIPGISSLSRVPWWAWLGGLLGAFLVTVTIYAVPKLGATTMFAVFIGGQMIASVIFDHFGILGYPEHPVSWIRMLGIALVFSGVVLIKYY